MSSAVIFQLQSVCILALMYVGVIFKRNRKIHVKLMSSAMIWDILLILQIELTRNAIVKASESMLGSKSMILNIHVSMAIACVVLYGFMVFTGRKLLRGEKGIRRKHKALGISTIILRTLVFITSFFVASPNGASL
ncbi:MAG: hypothetical protein COW79_01245 [Bdellovibrionales bacterium CG22_combo_CG10-13_8_21_14_all_38_13]|nr:MAG: hypothetical protein COW79_01245 [Bdellovibrionales bacterium CG22_combo_CG10-13_8_21_14_all_38_13]